MKKLLLLFIAGCAGKLLWVLNSCLSTLHVFLHSRMVFGIQLPFGLQLLCSKTALGGGYAALAAFGCSNASSQRRQRIHIRYSCMLA